MLRNAIRSSQWARARKGLQKAKVAKWEDELVRNPNNVEVLLKLGYELYEKAAYLESSLLLYRAHKLTCALRGTEHRCGDSKLSLHLARCYFRQWEANKLDVRSLEKAHVLFDEALSFVENAADPSVQYDLALLYVGYSSFDGALQIMARIM